MEKGNFVIKVVKKTSRAEKSKERDRKQGNKLVGTFFSHLREPILKL